MALVALIGGDARLPIYRRSCGFRCAPEDMEPGADSTTHCAQAEGKRRPPRQLRRADGLTWASVFQTEPFTSAFWSCRRAKTWATTSQSAGRKTAASRLDPIVKNTP